MVEKLILFRGYLADISSLLSNEEGHEVLALIFNEMKNIHLGTSVLYIEGNEDWNENASYYLQTIAYTMVKEGLENGKDTVSAVDAILKGKLTSIWNNQ